MNLLRLHAIAAWAFVITIVVQVFLAGAAIANLGGSGNFGTHVEFGYTWMGIAVLVLLVTALLARRPRGEFGYVAAILIVYVVQTMLPAAKASIPALAALHPVNALFLFALSIWYARRTWLASAAA